MDCRGAQARARVQKTESRRREWRIKPEEEETVQKSLLLTGRK